MRRTAQYVVKYRESPESPEQQKTFTVQADARGFQKQFAGATMKVEYGAAKEEDLTRRLDQEG